MTSTKMLLLLLSMALVALCSAQDISDDIMRYLMRNYWKTAQRNYKSDLKKKMEIREANLETKAVVHQRSLLTRVSREATKAHMAPVAHKDQAHMALVDLKDQVANKDQVAHKHQVAKVIQAARVVQVAQKDQLANKDLVANKDQVVKVVQVAHKDQLANRDQ
ncbi:hypothetical protein PANDA_020807, partial [Ailuropoda melanoleuca]